MIKHTTADGRKVKLSEIEDGHLLNILRFMIRRIKLAKEVLNGPRVDRFTELVEGPVMDEEVAKTIVANDINAMAHYFYEAMIRGLSIEPEIESMREILGRRGRWQSGGSQLFTKPLRELTEEEVKALF